MIYLKPISPDAPHPSLKDTDGGALMVDSEDARPVARVKLRWTKEELEALEKKNAAWRAWQKSPAGVAWSKRHL